MILVYIFGQSIQSNYNIFGCDSIGDISHGASHIINSFVTQLHDNIV